MAVTPTPALIQAANNGLASFIQGTDAAATYKTVLTAGANGSKVTGLIANTNDGTAAHVMTVSIKRSAVQYPVGNVNLPVNAGGDGVTAGVNLLDPTLVPGLPVDNDGQPYLLLKSGDTLEVTFATALTASKTIWVHAIGGDL